MNVLAVLYLILSILPYQEVSVHNTDDINIIYQVHNNIRMLIVGVLKSVRIQKHAILNNYVRFYYKDLINVA